MKKTLVLTLVTGTVIIISSARAQTSATLTDLNGATPTPGPDDISLLDTSAENEPIGLNYYIDNSAPPGQTFTTGSNPNGYLLTSLAVLAAGSGGGGITTNAQPYYLRIYSVNATGTNGTLLATYISQTNFTFFEGDWLQWSNLSIGFQPNTQYAWSFQRGRTGWELLGSDSGDEYTGGQAVLIPTAGGAMTTAFNSDGSYAPGYDAMMDIGLTGITSLIVNPPAFTPSSIVTNGAQVTATAAAFGAMPLYYQWQTDGGSGGALTNIPDATSATLGVDTTNLPLGAYRYDVVVTNSSYAVTSAVASLTIVYPTTPATLTDAGDNILSGASDINQLISGGNGNGLNYYDDNGAVQGNYAGQTFTTGTNSQGYYLTSVAIQTGGGGSSDTTTAQGYDLLIFSINGGNATLMAHYTATNFAFTFGDWLEWSGFSIPLKANTTYAYGFGNERTNTSFQSWAALNTSPSSSDLYSGGQICLIPSQGGPMTFGTNGLSDAVFDVGLLPVGVGPDPHPFANPIAVSPSRTIAVGTQVTLNETAGGQTPLHYQWLTDGGGGTLTNMPSTDTSNLVVNTTGWQPGLYQYEVIVNNSFGSSTSAVATVTILYANTTATLADLGIVTPSSGANDISQLTIPGGANSPDGLNYYFDNANPPGQTFTTGSNPAGYTLSSAAIDLAGNSGSLPAGGQSYLLRIYKVSGSTATLYAAYTSSPTNFIFANNTDWLRWSDFALPLDANATYAYTFGRSSTGSGWCNLANVGGNLYTGGEVATIPTAGGAINYGSSHSYDATFVLGLALAGYPIVTPPVFTPSNIVYAGTPVTVTASVTGSGSLTYQWQTDGGSGTFTNIPGATNPTLTVDTTPMGGQTASYALTAVNGSGATTGEASSLTVNPAQSPVPVTDITNSLNQLSSQVTTFIGGSVTFSDFSFQGSLPIYYQWQVSLDGNTFTNLPGQTNDTLALANLETAGSAYYMLVASNSIGSGATSAAYLTVLPQPTGPFTVNFQWHSTVAANSYDVGNYSGLGIPGYGTGTYWNQVIGPTTAAGGTYTSSSGYSDDGSTDLGLSWTLTISECWDWDSTPVIPLLDSAVTARPATPASFTFTLPNGLYNLVLFSCNGTESLTADGGAVFTVNGVSQMALPTQDTNFVQGDNYIVFTNVAVTGATLTGTCAAATGKSYGSLNGAQLQYLGPLVILNAHVVAGGQIELDWPQGTLLETTNLAGPWTTNSLATPPSYLVTPTGPQKFYRIKVQ